MQASPYRPGVIAESLPGREQQLLLAEERLSRMCDLAQLIGRVDVFTAARGFGKTSLLREIERRAQTRGAVTAWVTAGEESGLIAALVAAIHTASQTWKDAARLRPVIEQASMSLNLGLAGVQAQLRPRGTPELSGARALESLIRAVLAPGHRRSRRALVLFVDEVQAADAAGLRTLAYAWQHLQAEGPDLPAGVFAAGLPDAPQAIVNAVSSSERFSYIDLEPLAPPAVIQALAGAARPLGVDWEPAALQLAVAETSGYPYTVQLVGDHAWRLAGLPDPGTVVTEQLAEQACAATRQDLARLIDARYAKASPAEREFLLAMARVGDGPVRRADIVAALGVSSTSVSNQRDRLLKQGVIRASAYGMLEFTIPGMAAHLRQQDR